VGQPHRESSARSLSLPSLIVAKRFCGPPTSANGGYFAGLIAALSPGTLSVRLKAPPPLETELTVFETQDGGFEVRQGETVMGEGSPATLDLQPPALPQREEVVAAARHYAGVSSPFPTCFVCGVDRSPGDGLCIFASPVAGRDIVAARWTPDVSLSRGDGKVRPEFMSAALDCPGFFALQSMQIRLLAQFIVQLERRVEVGEPCTVIGWKISSSGRKHEAGTALFGADGELCGRARALWIDLRPTGA